MEKESRTLFTHTLLASALLGFLFVPLIAVVYRQLLLPLLGYLSAWGIMSVKTLLFSTFMLARIGSRRTAGWARYSVVFYLVTFLMLGGIVVLGVYVGKPFLAGLGAAVVANTLAVCTKSVIDHFKARTC